MISGEMLKRVLQSISDDQIEEALGDEDVIENVQGVIDTALPILFERMVPHLDDIRERAQMVDGEQRRVEYESLSRQERLDIFHVTAADLMLTLRLCKERPQDGFPRLKARLRNPDTIEPLLLIFDDDRIDDECGDEKKELVTQFVQSIGIQLFPEMYTNEEISSIQEEINGN